MITKQRAKKCASKTPERASPRVPKTSSSILEYHRLGLDCLSAKYSGSLSILAGATPICTLGMFSTDLACLARLRIEASRSSFILSKGLHYKWAFDYLWRSLQLAQ